MTQYKYLKYLNLKHDYINNNCITLISDIYQNELHTDCFKKIWELCKIPEGKVANGRNWMKQISLQNIDEWVSTIATKVNLTNLQEYDVIVFRSEERRFPNHFGMYVSKNRFIHLEEGKYSVIDVLNEHWRQQINNIYRWNGMINT